MLAHLGLTNISSYFYTCAMRPGCFGWLLQITLTIDTCPFPSSEELSATLISRNVTITSLPRGAPAGADAEAG
jgi:hypothetical protein